MKKQDAGDSHDRRAPGQNCRNRRERPAFLKKKKERDRSRADANASKQRIIESRSTEFLIPSSCTPEDQQVNQNGQCRAGFDNETAETLTNAIRSKTGKDLMRAVEYGSNDRVPKPGCHKTEA